MQALDRDKREHKRFQLPNPLDVIDTISKNSLGELVNISAKGLMLLGDKPILDGSVYQVKVRLTESGQHFLFMGIECLWKSESGSRTKYWSGYRIIDISDQNQTLLDRLIASL